MKNYELVNVVYRILSALKVDEIIVCAGARNAPFIVQSDSHLFKIKTYFEERSAGFYALGRIRATQKPVVVMTTSGTAVAELLPAVIEAYYQGLPLIVVSADRPKHYRGTGSPQSIEQKNIFGPYVQTCHDWDVFQNQFEIDYYQRQPIHFNICFDEPLIDSPAETQVHLANVYDVKINYFNPSHLSSNIDQLKLNKFKKPLFILGQLSNQNAEFVRHELVKYKIPHYAESLSGLLGNYELKDLQLNSLEGILTDLMIQNEFDSIIRVGGIPTLRLWRDLESKLKHVPVLNISEIEFSGLARESISLNFNALRNVVKNIETYSKKTIILNSKMHDEKNNLLTLHQNSEQNFIKRISSILNGQPIYIGNSLPIREWDLFSEGEFKTTYANRGANGIDGQISTYLGWADQFEVSWAIIGDLTALYDLAAFGLNNQNMFESMKRIVIINNRGGQIFKKIFSHDQFLNTHQIEFSGLAKLWKWDYIKINDILELEQMAVISKDKTQKHYLIEIQTDQSESDLVWKKMNELCQTIK